MRRKREGIQSGESRAVEWLIGAREGREERKRTVLVVVKKGETGAGQEKMVGRGAVSVVAGRGGGVVVMPAVLAVLDRREERRERRESPQSHQPPLLIVSRAGRQKLTLTPVVDGL